MNAKDEGQQAEYLGQVVREEWVKWAKEQPNPKASWLQPWQELTEAEREVDRRIGLRLYNHALDALYEPLVPAASLNALQQQVTELEGKAALAERLWSALASVTYNSHDAQCATWKLKNPGSDGQYLPTETVARACTCHPLFVDYNALTSPSTIAQEEQR